MHLRRLKEIFSHFFEMRQSNSLIDSQSWIIFLVLKASYWKMITWIHFSTFTFDPRGQPTVTAGSDHCFRTCCPSDFSKSSKNKTKFKWNNIYYWREIVGLAKWIIDDTCLVIFYFRNLFRVISFPSRKENENRYRTIRESGQNNLQ